MGEASIKKKEVILEVKADAAGTIKISQEIDPEKMGAGYLASMVKMFDQLRWESLSFEWVPCVGTTEGGTVFMGIDWDSSQPDKKDLTMNRVSACTPTTSTPLYRARTLNISAQRHQYQKWLRPHVDGQSLGLLLLFGSGPVNKTLGYIMADYHVLFQGTRLP